ncbi:hypothetical protein RhiirA5_476566 [Rhizophagus irregularis]|uniref:Uncharacterized protein n=1 Tax=Rhizophagus irregularis TaxID=588596 RepID=A0A2N0PPC2_9GLOM|nr:hypothetical protein RhiirA5_476566 [Rhizophagus irregularis]PKC74219.1 hypothetical protein RhiirA1_515953 [Rhizophagus irregularis]CAB4478846.1 unnamed protein product [Rhizophagus irregularis]CAB5109381.1 unnamed protein product [Rhizophagus irregularis]CAB5350124.1 unnamed protein product [Rhizophagus irregularis]
MSLSKKRKELHRDQSNTQTHWKPLELIGVLTFLNENFDLWSVNHLDASNKAIKETNINRDGKALYSKIYNMVKAMEDYVEKNNKSTSYTIMWENSKIYDLVKEMYDKTKETKETKEGERKKRKKETSNHMSNGDGDVTMKNNNTTTTNQIDVPQLPFTIETIDKVYNEQVQNYDRLIVINRDMIEKRNKEVRELYEQISRRQAELIKLIQKANNKLDELGKITGKSYMI